MNTELSLKAWVLICLRAERSCAQRFRLLGDRCRSSDPDLASRLSRLADDEERHVEALRNFDGKVPWPALWHLDDAALDRHVGLAFPALGVSADHISAEREPILAYAVAMERDAVSLYRHLEESLPDAAGARFFGELADLENGHLSEVTRPV